MLSLDSPKWAQLQHAYGSAADIPGLLRPLEDFPVAKDYRTEPWFSLWSALAHQGDVFSASFAAVPHIIGFISLAPMRASANYFHLPAWIEICRHHKNISVPEELSIDYYNSLKKFPELIESASTREWDESFLASTLAAIAVNKGFHELAECILDLTPDVLVDFRQWIESR